MLKNCNEIVLIVALEEELPKSELPELRIEYSGVGKINATYKTFEVIERFQPKLIINYGTAGTLKKELSGLHEVSGFYQRDMDVRQLGFEIGKTPFEKGMGLCFGRNGLTCGTGDTFVDSPPLLKTDLVDMEAYAIAKVCQLRDINFICFKYISDNVDTEAPNNWKKNVVLGKLAFKEHLSHIQFDF